MTPRFLKNKSEDLRIYFSDDDKIKSFGEVLTSDSGRLILKILLSESLTANQLAQKTSISLQLVKYHIDKMQGLGIGEKIIRSALMYAKSKGCYKTILDCDRKVKPFYEKIGFKAHSYGMRFDH